MARSSQPKSLLGASIVRQQVFKMTLCKYSSVIYLIIIAATLTPKLTNCQTTTRKITHDAIGPNCEQRRQQRTFSQRTITTSQQLQQLQHQHQQLQHQHQYQLQKQQQRRDMQLTRSAPIVSLPDTSAEQEEFSLAPGISNSQQQATSGNYTLLLPQQQQQQQQPTTNEPANASMNAPPTMPASKNADLTTATTTVMASTSGVSGSSTAAVPSDSISSFSVVLQPSATTTTSIQSQSSVASKTLSAATSLSSSSSPAATDLASNNNSTATTNAALASAPTSNSSAPIAQPQAQAAAALSSSLEMLANSKEALARRTDHDEQDEAIAATIATATATREASSSQVSKNHAEPTGTGEHQYQTSLRHDNLLPSQQNVPAITLATASSSSSGRQLIASASQPVSSSPSSISIITPLVGPPNQHAQHSMSSIALVGKASAAANLDSQQQSTMMKPLFVVGNPISERDYNGGVHEPTQQYQHKSALAAQLPSAASASDSSESQPPQMLGAKAAKGLGDLSPSEQQTLADFTGSVHDSQRTTTYQAYATGKVASAGEMGLDSQQQQKQSSDSANLTSHSGHSQSTNNADRMSGPPLIYSDGHLASIHTAADSVSGAGTANGNPSFALQSQAATQTTGAQPQLSPRLLQGQTGAGVAVLGNNPRRPSLPPPVNQANAASGFRSPMSPSGPLVGGQATSAQQLANAAASALQPPANSLAQGNVANFYQTSPPYAGANAMMPAPSAAIMSSPYNSQAAQHSKQAFVLSQQQQPTGSQQQQLVVAQSQVPTPSPGTAPGSNYSGRRPLNITRVEHISAECSSDLIRAVIVFNGTFKGIIYSSGYVNDPTCLYVNGTGSTRYEFSIRLNQCGTLGRQELHQPTIPGEARRRDQVMWNTLSIQYNSIIEQEWDEHFRVSCEYGSDFWKTVSFSPFNVETNTGSPVVFTINPPQCQMDVLLGHGMGPKIVDGPVTVGDPLTLLIHMKSEKAGYDILVKNCVAHNGGKQRMQLIDSNGCVVNERFISPFRGTYNDNDLRHVTLYAYLKAFRFTGSPVLYLECEIHMCQSACPPQMCYWRRLSKRSVDEIDYEYTTNSSSNSLRPNDNDEQPPLISDSLNLFKALQVRQESDSDKSRSRQEMREIYAEDDVAALICYRHAEVLLFLITIGSLLLLVIVIAITCCWRIRKLTRNPFGHSRLTQLSSLSPSLLSISDALSSASSIITTKGASAMPTWHYHYHQQHQHQQQQYQQRSGKQALKLAQSRQTVPSSISSFRANDASDCPSHR